MYLQGMKDNRARPFRKAEHGCVVRLLFRALIVRLKSLRLAFKIGYVVLPTTIELFSDNGFRGMNDNVSGRNYFKGNLSM